jgi:hypothetical protein
VPLQQREAAARLQQPQHPPRAPQAALLTRGPGGRAAGTQLPAGHKLLNCVCCGLLTCRTT